MYALFATLFSISDKYPLSTVNIHQITSQRIEWYIPEEASPNSIIKDDFFCKTRALFKTTKEFSFISTHWYRLIITFMTSAYLTYRVICHIRKKKRIKVRLLLSLTVNIRIFVKCYGRFGLYVIISIYALEIETENLYLNENVLIIYNSLIYI